MAQNLVTSRATLISHCKRSLGFGVVDINVTDDQVDDSVDNAMIGGHLVSENSLMRAVPARR